jgi:hypothetical protein
MIVRSRTKGQGVCFRLFDVVHLIFSFHPATHNSFLEFYIDIYLSFHKILTWQVPADIELANMSTQKISLLHRQKNYATSINNHTNMCSTNSEQ